MRLVVARCQVDYVGRLTAHLPEALRLILIKADGSVSVHADDRAYKPLNWMSPPCTLTEESQPDADTGEPGRWVVRNKAGEELIIGVAEIVSDSSFDLGVDPGLQKDGVEAHLQELLAEQCHVLADDLQLIRREYPTDIGPVDLLCRDNQGTVWAIEIKRRGDIDGVEQLARYIERLQHDARLRPLKGMFVAQSIKPQAKVLAEARGLLWREVDYDALRGMEPTIPVLF